MVTTNCLMAVSNALHPIPTTRHTTRRYPAFKLCLRVSSNSLRQTLRGTGTPPLGLRTGTPRPTGPHVLHTWHLCASSLCTTSPACAKLAPPLFTLRHRAAASSPPCSCSLLDAPPSASSFYGGICGGFTARGRQGKKRKTSTRLRIYAYHTRSRENA